MRVAIVENMKSTPLGSLGVALAEANAEIEYFRPWIDGRLPRGIFDHDALVVLGGEQNALDDENYPYLPALARLMHRFSESGRAVLGICLGAQILARAYGAENRLNLALEFGWRSGALPMARNSISRPVATSSTVGPWSSRRRSSAWNPAGWCATRLFQRPMRHMPTPAALPSLGTGFA
jgi:GMP synthase-like glutamine amidotransferase